MGTASGADPPLVGTLGMFIVDTFRYIDEDTGIDQGDRGRGEVLGGGGLYCAIGARIWLPSTQVKAVIDRGYDFQQAGYQAVLEHYATGSSTTASGLWKWRDRQGGTTKAVNIYRGQQRGFDYLTPKLRLDPSDLADTETGQLPRYLHAICSPDRASVICDQVDELDLKAYGSKGRTKICWEPIPDSAVPENLEECLRVMARIEVLSPNHEEAASFLSVEPSLIEVPSGSLTIEQSAACRASHLQYLAHEFRQRFLDAHRGQQSRCPTIVVRGGAAGSVALESLDSDYTLEASIPAWHTASESGKVVDVTGGGNSFMGGLLAGMATDSTIATKSLRTRQRWLEEALRRGAVSASFIIEQLGIPELEYDGDSDERWNGQTAKERLARYG